jgi:enoyl-CoA hydratase
MTNNNAAADKVEVIKDEAVTRVTIQRPKRLNALDVDVLERLAEAVTEAARDGTRVMVISGAGEKAFVAGADIGMMEHFTPRQALEFSRKGHHLMLALDKAPFISIARVQGYALGGGCELAMACDLIIASEKAVFGQPEVGLGLIPGFGGTQMLAVRIGLSVAMDLLVTGRRIGGRDAAALGLASRVSAHDRLDEEVEDAVKGVLKGDAHAIREAKRLLRQSLHMPFEQGLSSEAASFGNCFDRQSTGEDPKISRRRHGGETR